MELRQRDSLAAARPRGPSPCSAAAVGRSGAAEKGNPARLGTKQEGPQSLANLGLGEFCHHADLGRLGGRGMRLSERPLEKGRFLESTLNGALGCSGR